MVQTKYAFGALAQTVRISDGAGAPVFNTGIAYQLGAGPDGVKLTHLHVGPTLIANAEAAGIGTRLLVIDGDVPDDVTPFQQNFEPTVVDIFPVESSLAEPWPVLYAAMYQQALDAAGARTANVPDHCDFDDGRCPEILGAGNLSVLLVPMFSDAMIAAMVPDMFVYLQMNAFGSTPGVRGETSRNIPPSRVGRL